MCTFFILFISAKLASGIGHNVWMDNVTNIDGVFRLYSNDKIVHISDAHNTTLRNETTLIQQSQGNLVLYHNSVPLWDSVTGPNQQHNPQGNYTQLNMDGNLQVIETGKNTPAWETNTTGHDNGKPHTLVVAHKCVYIMDRDGNIFWTPAWGKNGLDCSLYGLDLVIQHSTQPRPASPNITTEMYGRTSTGNTPSQMFDQGRISAISNWGIAFAIGTPINYPNYNTLYVTDWDADRLNGSAMIMGSAPSNVEPIACDRFVLNDNDYIIGYTIYDSDDYVHGITFYTSLGCAYQCFGDVNMMNGLSGIAKNGIVSYYYGVNDFWYLSGFKGIFGSLIQTLRLQFTKLPDDVNLTTTDKLMCHITLSPTFNPTSEPTSGTSDPTSNPTPPTLIPTHVPTLNPTLPTLNPTHVPTLNPTHLPTLNPTYVPTLNPTQNPTSNPTDVPSSDPSLIPTISPTNYPTYMPTIHTTTKTIHLITTNIVPVSVQGNNASDNSILAVVLLLASCLVVIFLVKYLYDKRHEVLHLTPQNEDGNKFKLRGVERVNDLNIVDDACDVDAHDNNPKHRLIMQWLTDEVKLPQYVECFVENGYDDMVLIRDIVDKRQLKEIGIKQLGHRTRILAQIELLPKEEGVTDVIGYTEEGHGGNVMKHNELETNGAMEINEDSVELATIC